MKSLEGLIPHVFQPLQLPRDPGDTVVVESRLLSLVTEVLNEIKLNTDVEILQGVLNTFLSWENLQCQENLDHKYVRTAIRDLKPGEELSLYIRNQNTGILISIPDEIEPENGEFNNGSKTNGVGSGDEQKEKIAIFSTFVASQPSEVVTSAAGSLAAIFPTTSVTVPWSNVLTSSCFARQLATLSNYQDCQSMPSAMKSGHETTENREVASPIFVSQWLTAVLANEKSKQSSKKQMPRIAKKIRDKVMFSTGLPYRRSGLWMCVKVTLHLILVRQLGEVEGIFLYKLIMLKLMLKFVQSVKLMNLGLVMHMIGKIARRTLKLQNFKNANPSMAKYLNIFFDEVTSDAARVLQTTRSTLKTTWEDIIDAEKKESSISSIKGNLDIYHSLKHNGLIEYLTMDTRKVLGHVSRITVPEPSAAQRHISDTVPYPPIFFQDKDPNHLPTILYDFEFNAKNWQNIITINDAEYVCGIFQIYIALAKQFYTNDPVGMSRMILTCLNIIHVWDSLCVNHFPLLKEHRPGVNGEFTHMLLLPQRTDMHQLGMLEDYFSRRENEASFPSLIEKQEITVNSFGHRYAQSDTIMQRVKEEILRYSEVEETATMEKVRFKRIECEKYRNDIKTLECEYEYKEWKRYHVRNCKKCILIEKEKKCVVKVFEKPLPNNEECQNAIVFELLIPAPIACLRDMLFLFGANVVSSIICEDQELYGPWIEYERLAKYMQIGTPPRSITMMSTTKLFLETHYRTQHATNPDSDFIKKNGYNCRIAGSGRLFRHIRPTGVKPFCTFRVEKKSPYYNLQWAINGNEMSFNQVLARQNECHQDLSLLEFVEFCSIRCSYYIQMRSLYRALTQMALSLKNLSVFNLICQILWQTGTNACGVMYRDPHLELDNNYFTFEFLRLFEQIRKKHAHNWKDHYVLLTIIVFTLRVISLSNNTQLVQTAFILLDRCRDIACQWSRDIQKIQSSSIDCPRTELDSLRLKTIEVNVLICYTYSFESHHYDRLRNPTTVATWLGAIAKIYDNTVLLGSGYTSRKEVFNKFPIVLQNLIRRVNETGLNLEPFFHRYFQDDPQPLNLFVRKQYSGADFFAEVASTDGVIWRQHHKVSSVYICELSSGNVGRESCTLQMDIVGGTFLVDGCPVTYLPSPIENHPDFQRVFPMKSFEVKPVPFQRGRFITCDKIGNSYYSFFLKSDPKNMNSLIITEDCDGEQYELLPPFLLDKNIPYLLIDDCTHWWNKKREFIYFFKRDPNKPLKLFNQPACFVIHLGKSIVLKDLLFCSQVAHSNDRSRQMVDINCTPYSRIVDIIKRLEYKKFVNIWYKVDGNKKEYIVELPRMGLHFSVDLRQNRYGKFGKPLPPLLMSKEYRGMKIAECQKLDTLIGLKHGLLLEDSNFNSKAKMSSILLMPHGQPMIKGNNNVEIYIKQLRTPAFFAYEVDDTLKQLKARESQSAWLFLAYLHAITSSALPDPFTQVTGTERAFQILQSGHCWSCQPTDEESLRTLQDIVKLSPVRRYYPPKMKTMETVEWNVNYSSPTPITDEGGLPISLFPQVSHDGFQIIVKKIIEDSQRLDFLFTQNGNAPRGDNVPADGFYGVVFQSDPELCIKAYWERIGLSTQEARISSSFNEDYAIDKSPAIQQIGYSSAYDLTFTDDQMRTILAVSQLFHKWKYCTPKAPLHLIKTLLFTIPDDLKGALLFESGNGINSQKKEDWRVWTELNFRDSWLDLYDLARNVTRQKMEPVWIHLLTFLAFRVQNPIALDHLLFLHTIAVNSSDFEDLNPPSYGTYFMTNEFEFREKEIKNIFKKYSKSWEIYMEEHQDEQLGHEDTGEFIDRMKPIYEEAIEEQIKSLTDLLKKAWPIENCEQVRLFSSSSGSSSEEEEYEDVNYHEATTDINVLLKNWYHNLELFNFIEGVENLVKVLKEANDKYCGLFDVGKYLLRNTEQRLLNDFCKKSLFTVDFENVIGERDISLIDKELLNKAEGIFNIIAKPVKPANALPPPLNKRNSIEQFPLSSSKTCPILETYMRELEESWIESQKALKFQNRRNSNAHYEPWMQKLSRNRTQTNEMWEKVKDIIKPQGNNCDNVTKCLVKAEIYPRTTGLSLLPLICNNYNRKPYLNYIRNLLGAYAVLLTVEQRSARCARYSMKGRESVQYQVELDAEQNNPGHENWNPSERPQWLLFEVEMDIMIRPIQAKVAERMKNPTEGLNALLQLNMGEGKTAVIVPLVILSLANGEQLCRVTVLKSLYEINQKALISNLGGILLNRRVYTFPCRRDYNLAQSEVIKIGEVYKECMNKKGVVITLPEYRLSFLLKAYEKCGAENFIDGREFLQVQNWLDANTRDILDESDEILQVKYQLIYTIGKQMSVGGGSMRWSVIQRVLKLIPYHLRNLIKQHGYDNIEIIERSEQKQAYPFCRLLKPDFNEKLSNLLARDVINGTSGIQIPSVTNKNKKIVLEFLTNNLVDRNVINTTYDLFPLEVHREILLILRGLLACGVLGTAYSKRWRVNYGVNPSGYRRVAIPFRAKDVASERTEFGHPDIAIVLTQLCYYYSGLSDEQLEQCFVHLFLQPDPTVEYNLWISLVSPDYKGLISIKTLSGVNLKDFYQRTEILFPALRLNMATIDFWLSQVVFPQESKQFAWKIGCSPWDLCAKTKLPTTGFSGTNESKLLLPMTIKQADLAELQGTNGSVLKNLLRRENNNYEALPAGVSGKEILQRLLDKNIRILLDVGALMLELNNEQVAKKWLELQDEDHVDAAVYFDQNNKLVVIDRMQRRPVSLELSTYRTRLDRCVIYLDDAHTRGTDLKIPQGAIGCVTLGKGVTKDKLVQGCMRMRKLGQGHSVVFWAAWEVDNAIKAMVGGGGSETAAEDSSSVSVTIGSKQVLEWAIENSRMAIEDGFIHWASAGVYQAQKLSSHVLFQNSPRTDQDLKLLAESCSQKETTDLKTMYGDVRTVHPFPTIVDFLLKRVRREMEKRLVRAGKDIQQNVEFIVNSFGECVVRHTQKYVATITRSSQTTDEEQERELEHELEAQQEKELPPKYKALDNSINPAVENFILHGDLRGIEHWAVKLPLGLRKTHIWNLCRVDTWAQNIYATTEFVNVIKPDQNTKNDILRPPHWICSVFRNENEIQRQKQAKAILLLISPFEADYFINSFRHGTTKATLHMFAPRLSPDQDTLCNNGKLTVPCRIPRTTAEIMPLIPINMHANLLLFTGSSYFSCKIECDAYCKIVGFCLQERNPNERQVFEEGGIIDGFFVKPEFRQRLGLESCQFKDNPEALIREIIRVRYGNFSTDSHIGKMIHQCRKPFNDE